MKYNEKKLEKWALNIPECEDFLYGFFMTCKEDLPSALENYLNDIKGYSRTDRAIRVNSNRLFQAFYDISGMKVCYG